MTGLMVPRLSLAVVCSSQSLVKSTMPCSVIDHSSGGFQAASDEYEGIEFSILAMSSFTVSSAPVKVAWYTSAQRRDTQQPWRC